MKLRDLFKVIKKEQGFDILPKPDKIQTFKNNAGFLKDIKADFTLSKTFPYKPQRKV
jgi:hypothetical protein